MRLRRRKTVNLVMLSATGVCALIAVSSLFVILAFLLYNGTKSLDWNFFTQLPRPIGEVGGGLVNRQSGRCRPRPSLDRKVNKVNTARFIVTLSRRQPR